MHLKALISFYLFPLSYNTAVWLLVKPNSIQRFYSQTERVFDGEYGSKLEQSLEEESDELEHKLERLELVLQQWSQAEVCTSCLVNVLAMLKCLVVAAFIFVVLQV